MTKILQAKSKRRSSCLVVGIHAAALALAALTLSCSQSLKRGDPSPADSALAPVPNSYENLIDRYSAGEAKYSGFYNNFEYRATLMNSSVRSAMLKRQGEYYQWAQDKMATEKEKVDKEMASSTLVFLAFYTPDRKNDNLTDDKSIWRVYLDAGTKRFPGKIRKVKTLLAEVQSLFPYHTRWTTAYEVSFPVATGTLEAQPSTLTVTGPLGTKTVSFPPLR